MKEELRWEKTYRLQQEHNKLLSQIRNELARIANYMANAAPEEDDYIVEEKEDESLKEENDDSI